MTKDRRQMRSYHFPNMFKANSSDIWKSSEYSEATKQNTELLLQCERGELFGDPYYGLPLSEYLFDQNSIVIRDAIADMVYTQLAIFMPQVKVKRSGIEILQDREKGKLYCVIHGVSQIDYLPKTLSLTLFDEADQ